MLNILFFSFLTFFVFLFLFSISFRFFGIKNDFIFLVIFFLILPVPLFFYFVTINFFSNFEIVMLLCLFYLLSLTFIQTFPALKENIPSIKILFFIFKNPGLNNSEVINILLEFDNFIEHKNEELASDSFVTLRNGKYQLTLIGNLIVLFFLFYRKILGKNNNNG